MNVEQWVVPCSLLEEWLKGTQPPGWEWKKVPSDARIVEFHSVLPRNQFNQLIITIEHASLREAKGYQMIWENFAYPTPGGEAEKEYGRL